MARYILKGHKRAFPDNPRPNSLTNVWQAGYTEVPILPPGGTTNQVLAKESNLDYDVKWSTPNTGTLTGANNGLSLSGLIAQLGGTLIKNTTIAGATFNLTITNLGTFAIEADAYNILANASFSLRTPNVFNTTAISGQYLRLNNAASGAAEWADLPNIAPRFISSNTTANAGDLNIIDATSGVVTLTLPASPLAGDTVVATKKDAINNVNLAAGVGHTIDGASGAILLSQYAAITVVFDGVSEWVITSRYLT